MKNDDKILVGKIVAPQGLRGEFRVQTYSATETDFKKFHIESASDSAAGSAGKVSGRGVDRRKGQPRLRYGSACARIQPRDAGRLLGALGVAIFGKGGAIH